MSKKHRLKTINPTTPIKETKDTSPRIPQRDKIKNELHIYERPDFTEKQKEFIRLALDKNTKVMFCHGPSGTSKSLLSVYCALHLISNKKVSDLLYLRSIVESSDSKIGFVPGTIFDKTLPYLEPLLSKLEELVPKSEISFLLKDNRVVGSPISYLRGLNWNAKAIIADEAQCYTFNELTTLITRMGEFSKLFVIGDIDQIDILPGKSGFKAMTNVFDNPESRANGIFTFKFTEEDCVRSALCKFILKKLKEARS